MWIAAEPRKEFPRFTIMSWMRADGGQDFASFASEKQPARRFDEEMTTKLYPHPKGSFIHERRREGLSGISPMRCPGNRARLVAFKNLSATLSGNILVMARLGSS
jgi:hypothetical protein